MPSLLFLGFLYVNAPTPRHAPGVVRRYAVNTCPTPLQTTTRRRHQHNGVCNAIRLHNNPSATGGKRQRYPRATTNRPISRTRKSSCRDTRKTFPADERKVWQITVSLLRPPPSETASTHTQAAAFTKAAVGSATAFRSRPNEKGVTRATLIAKTHCVLFNSPRRVPSSHPVTSAAATGTRESRALNALGGNERLTETARPLNKRTHERGCVRGMSSPQRRQVRLEKAQRRKRGPHGAEWSLVKREEEEALSGEDGKTTYTEEAGCCHSLTRDPETVDLGEYSREEAWERKNIDRRDVTGGR
ncbi:hypothetical protein MRX96_052068 [Rhipicephalus microplus]